MTTKTHTENVTFEMEIPDGYRCIGYRPPVIGEYYLYGYEVCRAKTFNHSTAYLILEEVHKGPVIEYILQCHDSRFVKHSLTLDSWEFAEKMDAIAHLGYTLNGKGYDLIRFNSPIGQRIGLGHWNDGPEESGQ